MVLCGMGSSLFPFSFLRIPSSAFLGSVPDIFEYMTTLLFLLIAALLSRAWGGRVVLGSDLFLYGWAIYFINSIPVSSLVRWDIDPVFFSLISFLPIHLVPLISTRSRKIGICRVITWIGILCMYVVCECVWYVCGMSLRLEAGRGEGGRGQGEIGSG